MLRRFFRYFGGMINHPRATLDSLAQEPSICFAVLLVACGLLLTLLNLAIFAALGYDWLGTRRELPDPIYVAFFGRLSLGTESYAALFNCHFLHTQRPIPGRRAPEPADRASLPLHCRPDREFGPQVQILWWFYMIGVYILAKDVCSIALGALAIRRVQGIPVWAAILIMSFSYLLWYYGIAGTFVR